MCFNCVDFLPSFNAARSPWACAIPWSLCPVPLGFFVLFCFLNFGFVYLFIYLFIYLWLCWVFVSVRGLSLVAASGGHFSSRRAASHYRGLSCCGAQAPDAQAQQLWLTGPVAPRYVGFSQTRARTRVPCISRQILNHCATREAQVPLFLSVVWARKSPRISGVEALLFIFFI